MFENLRIKRRLVPPVALDNRRIKRARWTGWPRFVSNTVQDRRSPGVDLRNLVLRERGGQPRRWETNIPLVDMDMMLEVPRKGYVLILLGTLLGFPREWFGKLGEQSANGQLVIEGHNVRRLRDNIGVLLVFGRQWRRPLVGVQKLERHTKPKNICFRCCVLTLYSHGQGLQLVIFPYMVRSN